MDRIRMMIVVCRKSVEGGVTCDMRNWHQEWMDRDSEDVEKHTEKKN